MMNRNICWMAVLTLLISCGSKSRTGDDTDPIKDVVFVPGEDSTGEWDGQDRPDGWKPGEDGLGPDSTDPTDVGDQEGRFLPDGTLPSTLEIKIVSPDASAAVSGTVRVRIEATGYTELEVDDLTVSTGGNFGWRDKKLPSEFYLDTRAYPQDAPLKIEATAKLGGKTGKDTIELALGNTPFQFVNVSSESSTVRNQDLIEIRVEVGTPGLDLTADFQELDSTWSAGKEAVHTNPDGSYVISYTIGTANNRPDGTWTVPLRLSDGSRTIQYGHLGFALQNRPLNPLQIEGAIFVPGTIPVADPQWVQPISLLYGNDFIITGGSAKLGVDFGGYILRHEIVGILVGVEGYYGYYQLPMDGSGGDEMLKALLRNYTDDETPPGSLPVRVALRDAKGRISPQRNRSLSVQSVGGGDVQVSISWDSKTDVDLHVIEPGGCELYYGKKSCPSGGHLDLDSNAACNIDNVNNENVFWPEGTAPLGTYTVRVDYYDDCGLWGAGMDANYTVTVHYCGRVETYDGFFAKGTDTGGGAGSGVTVAEFNNEFCGRVLRGRVRYEDRPIDPNGFAASTWRAVRFAQVEVRRNVDDKVVGTGYTDRYGNYEVQFLNSEAPGIYLRVRPQTNEEDGLRSVHVMNHPKFQVVYKVDSPLYMENDIQEPRIDLDITTAQGAGAFNIFDVVLEGYDLIRLMTGKVLGELRVFWATGADTTDTLFCSQFFYDTGVCTELGALSVQGKDTDRDEYDDQVILKEFFKFALERVARDDNPGGLHWGVRTDPTLAWSEGVTTFFAADVLRSAWFVNSRPRGVYEAYHLETWNSPFSKARPGHTLTAPVSAPLVASLLWDLADGASALEPFDKFIEKRLPVYDTIFRYFFSDFYADRGVKGVDLVDFLDGWFCREWKMNSEMTTLLGEYGVSYDFDGPSGCAVH